MNNSNYLMSSPRILGSSRISQYSKIVQVLNSSRSSSENESDDEEHGVKSGRNLKATDYIDTGRKKMSYF